MFDRLKAPFPPERISWRVGSTTKDKSKGMALAYVDARDVMERLDEVCGPGGWQCHYPHANGKTVCAISIKVDGEWVSKEDGAGDSDIEAIKGALSDAFKRAAVRWGIGRYLYDIASPWVELEDGKRIKDSEMPKLRAALGGSLATKPTPKPIELKPVPYISGDWTPAKAATFTRTFLDVARTLDADTRQKFYKLNEPAIMDLRLSSDAAADYIDNKFMELN